MRSCLIAALAVCCVPVQAQAAVAQAPGFGSGLPLLAAIGAAAFLAGIVCFRLRAYYALPTLEQYLREHPDAKRIPGGIRCANCGSDGIHLRFVLWKRDLAGRRQHVCLNCGRMLFRSRDRG